MVLTNVISPSTGDTAWVYSVMVDENNIYARCCNIEYEDDNTVSKDLIVEKLMKDGWKLK